jgi:hypothetical protein
MISMGKLARSIFGCTITILISIGANTARAEDINIGVVKHDLVSGLCQSNLPNTKSPILVVPFLNKKSATAIAKMNINGKDIRLKQVNLRVVNKTRSIATYRAKKISVTVNSRTIEEHEEPMYSSRTLDKISINYQGKTKTINTTGQCN